ncbi:hypothetical protein Tco_1100949 [Tanacetum coccineum]
MSPVVEEIFKCDVIISILFWVIIEYSENFPLHRSFDSTDRKKNKIPSEVNSASISGSSLLPQSRLTGFRKRLIKRDLLRERFDIFSQSIAYAITGTDISKLTRKQSSTDTRIRRGQKEAKDPKPKPEKSNPVKHG